MAKMSPNVTDQVEDIKSASAVSIKVVEKTRYSLSFPFCVLYLIHKNL